MMISYCVRCGKPAPSSVDPRADYCLCPACAKLEAAAAAAEEYEYNDDEYVD
jgi:recombinational DNA repair protein (RecF pathway)